MTIGRPNPGVEAPRKLAEVLEGARRGVVAVRGAESGSGWVALANGLVVTSLEVVGYVADATIALDDGLKVPARVVGCDVGWDAAFLLPKSHLGVAPLRRAALVPKLGDGLLALGRCPPPALSVLPLAVACAERSLRGRVHFELAARVSREGRGGPVLDGEGRVVGFVTRSAAPGLSGSLVAPLSAIERDLAALDRPAAQIGDRAPVYRCPACNDVLALDCDRCLACGAALPHTSGDDAIAGPERLVRETLGALGVVANRVRRAPRVWRFLHAKASAPATEVVVRVGAGADQILLRTPIVRAPASGNEALFRLLLTMNDQTAGVSRLSIAGDVVYLSFVAAIAGAREADLAYAIDDLVVQGDHYRRAISSAYGAEPILETLDDSLPL